MKKFGRNSKKPSQLMILPMMLMTAFGASAFAATLPGFGVTASGTTGKLSLTANINVADADVGKTGNDYVGLNYGQTWLFNNGDGWVMFDGGALPIYATAPLVNRSIQVINNANVTGLTGAKIFVGYGLTESDMRVNNKFGMVYTLGAATGALPIGTGVSPTIAVSTTSGTKGPGYSVDSTTPSITVSGAFPKMVSPVLTGGGFINVVNNAEAHVAATQTGKGTLSIVNNGAVLTATNTGSGMMTINSTDTAGAVTVTNTGNGNVTVNATPSDSVLTLTYSDDLDHTYPIHGVAAGSSVGISSNSHIHVSGANAGDVTSVLTDPTNVGSITVVNNGAHVAATQTGAGAINVTNNGQVMAATNTGTGTMTINSTATGAVAVTRTGNGNTTVTATGATPLALAFHGDGDVTYPAINGAANSSSLTANARITVSGSHALDVAPVLTGGGSINVANNGAHVAATQDGTGAINIVNNGQVMAATNTGSGVMTINSNATGAVAITKKGKGNTTVNATGSSAISCTYNDDLDHNDIANVANPACVAASITAGVGSSIGVSANPKITVSGSNAGAVTTTINDPSGTGSINVTNNGSGFDTATLTGTGSITIVNTGAGVTATNNGNGAMSINSTCTAAVTVTNTGNGKVSVTAAGSNPITLTHTGDDDFTYPVVGSATGTGVGTGVNSGVGGPLSNSHIAVFGSNAGAVTPTLVGTGFINVTNNGSGGVTATETGAGTINVINSGAGVTATNTGDGVMTITGSNSAAVTVTNTGNGNITVTATGSTPLTLTYTDGLDHVYP